MDKIDLCTRITDILKEENDEVSLQNRIADLISVEVVADAPIILKKSILNCHSCNLRTNANKAVPGKGPIASPIMFIGEGPGVVEDSKGEPFAGPSGRILNNILRSIQAKSEHPEVWKRENIYITNIVKCQPPNNRTPNMEEIGACAQYLRREIELVQPKIIVCWGTTAADNVIHMGFNMDSEQGNIFTYPQYGSTILMALYHPAYILHLNNDKEAVKQAKLRVWDGILRLDKFISENIDIMVPQSV